MVTKKGKPLLEVPPFGITVLWGARKVGKTVGAANSPWKPVHFIDVENKIVSEAKKTLIDMMTNEPDPEGRPPPHGIP